MRAVVLMRYSGDTNRSSDQYLKMNNCGYGNYVADGIPKMTFREFGRVDYHILYVVRGVGEVRYENERYRLSTGDGVLYPPGVPHEYSFPIEGDAMTLWVHFSGTAVEEILKQCGLSGGVFHVNSPNEVETIGSRMVREFALYNRDANRKNSADEVMLNGLLMNWIAALLRNRELPLSDEPIVAALEYINRNYNRRDSMESLAALCRLSTSRFLHRFKALTGVSPNQYRLSLRMERAKELLSDPALTVTEVAYAVGFTDPLYFSRAFRRENGVSPQEYRKTER